MDKEFEQLSRAARRRHLGNISITDRAILGIYQRAAERLARQAGSAKADSLTERWLKDYEQAVRETIGDMGMSLHGVIVSGAARSAQLPADATGAWLYDALQSAGIDERFRGVLSSVPTDALRSMLDGGMYSDRRTLSARIWNETGRLHDGIEQVVAQGIAQKQSALQIARSLEAYVNPDAACPYDWRNVYPDIPFPLKVDYNAQRLARTAINHAYWGANKMSAELNPLCFGMQWFLSDSHYVRQIKPFGRDECDEYAEHDEGLGKGVWPVEKLPRPHPQCLCMQVQAVPPMADAVDRLIAWQGGADDPALDAGFDRWNEDIAATATSKRPFMDDGTLRLKNPGGARIGAEVVKAVEAIGERITGDFPVLNRVVGGVHLRPEPGIAAFGTGVNARGIFETGIALDPTAWQSMDSIKAMFDSALASGHTVGTNDPMFIFSHEVGHALHTALALQDAGYTPGNIMTQEQMSAYTAARDAILKEAFMENDVFRSTEYDTPDKIYRAIGEEMGWRGKEPGEFIAQSVAMVYNGRGRSPVADAVVKWLKRRLT